MRPSPGTSVVTLSPSFHFLLKTATCLEGSFFYNLCVVAMGLLCVSVKKYPLQVVRAQPGLSGLRTLAANPKKRPEFFPWDPHGKGRDSILGSCPLTSHLGAMLPPKNV